MADLGAFAGIEKMGPPGAQQDNAQGMGVGAQGQARDVPPESLGAFAGLAKQNNSQAVQAPVVAGPSYFDVIINFRCIFSLYLLSCS